jgi:hypothetical protein
MVERAFDITGADTLAMQQYVNTFRRSEYVGPEKLLLAAILDDAIEKYFKYYRANDLDGKRRFAEVKKWVMQENEGWIFSFENVCELLDLVPSYVRRELRKIEIKPAEDQKRTPS